MTKPETAVCRLSTSLLKSHRRMCRYHDRHQVAVQTEQRAGIPSETLLTTVMLLYTFNGNYLVFCAVLCRMQLPAHSGHAEKEAFSPI